MPERELAEAGRESGPAGTTRRGMLRGAVGVSAAGLAAGVFAGVAATPAGATTTRDAAGDEAVPAAPVEPLIVHVHDPRTGVVDLYAGESHVRVTDHQLAARLARAAR